MVHLLAAIRIGRLRGLKQEWKIAKYPLLDLNPTHYRVAGATFMPMKPLHVCRRRFAIATESPEGN